MPKTENVYATALNRAVIQVSGGVESRLMGNPTFQAPLTAPPSTSRGSTSKRQRRENRGAWRPDVDVDLAGPASTCGRTSEFSTTLLTDPAVLGRFVEDLNQLAAASSEPNVFYEPWMLLPALKGFGSDKSFLFLLVFRNQNGRDPQLCGFFPLEVVNGVGPLPVRVARLWSYLHFHWCPPLVRSGYENECFQAFFAWAHSRHNPCSLIEFAWLPAEGILSRCLIDAIHRKGFLCWISDLHTRALLSRPDNPGGRISALSGRRAKEFNRLKRRLAEKGELTCEQLTWEGAVAEWIQGFLSLEVKGWKGRGGTALASSKSQKEFFSESVRSAFRRGQLMMLRLRLDNRSIAYKCNFFSAPGAFAFKIAYDEDYGQFSPGVLLELENIRQFDTMAGLRWMDSCADADHFMANHLWRDRRAVQTTWIAVGGRGSELLLSLLPLLKWTKDAIQSRFRKMVTRSTS